VLTRQTNVTLATLTRAQLVQFAGKETPDAIRQKLGQIVDTQERIAALQTDISNTQSQIDVVFRDQTRLRDNIGVLRDTREDQELRSRYLGQLKTQEDQVAAWRAHIDAVEKDLTAAKTSLSNLISNLTWQ
jgi:chromosome segregation ATPase